MDHAASLYHPIDIGKLTVPGNLFLAPLAGYTDRAFRELCYAYGADFCYTEMVSAEAIARGNEKSLALMERGDDERLLGIQIFLSEPEQAVRALPALLRYEPSLIDINCGCPVPKVVKTGAGAALMRSPATIHAIVAALTSRTDVPVTVKVRSGWDAGSINYREAARAAEEAGASAVGFHARTRAKGYSGTADWSLVADLAASVSVPVIGSGDLFSPGAVRDMLAQTGCAGVMCARGAIGNPFIFSDGRRLLTDSPSGRESADTSPRVRMETALQHFARALYYRGERIAVKEMKKHLAAYTKGLPGGSALRDSLMRCGSEECYRSIFRDYLSSTSPHLD
jgi:nifR3 family TIM-barrel protein